MQDSQVHTECRTRRSILNAGLTGSYNHASSQVHTECRQLVQGITLASFVMGLLKKKVQEILTVKGGI